jgi:hypothetical protein
LRAAELFQAVIQYALKSPTREDLEVLALLCERLTDDARGFSKEIIGVFRDSRVNFHSIENCRIFARIVRVLGCHPGFSLCELVPECYFVIAEAVIQGNPDLVDPASVRGVLADERPGHRAAVSPGFVRAAVSFAHAYENEREKIIQICLSRIDDDPLIRLLFLSSFHFVKEFPIQDYWEVALGSFATKTRRCGWPPSQPSSRSSTGCRRKTAEGT